jgi:hypothetical protein
MVRARGEEVVKVIRVDNYDDEGPRGNQRLLAGPGLSPEVAEVVARTLNECPARLDHDYYRAVTDDYELWRFEL